MKHLIIDGNNISNIAFYRAKSVLEKEHKDDLESVDKILCSFSVNVFLNIFHMYLKDNKNHKVYMVWDSRSGANWRKQQLETYKANRDHSAIKNHDILYDVMDSIKKLLINYPIYQIEIEHAEADDLIYSLCNILQGSKKIISSDGDMMQLPQKFSDVKIWHPMLKKYREVPEYDVILYKSICGDPSDGIEGLHKFGPKKTLKVLEEGLSSLSPEHLSIVEHNRTIIDLSKNPSCAENTKKVQEIISSYQKDYNFNKIQKMYLDLKLKQHFSNSDLIKKMLDNVLETYMV